MWGDRCRNATCRDETFPLYGSIKGGSFNGAPKRRLSVQLSLHLVVPLALEDLRLALVGFKLAPDEPVGLVRGEPRAGFRADAPLSAFESLRPVRLHFRRH